MDFLADYDPATKLGFSSGAKVTIAPDARIAEALDAIRTAMTPAPQDVILAWLAELSVRTRRREHDAFDDALTVEVYSRELGRYPADVVKTALKHRWRFWPALDDELIPLCDRLTRGRKRALALAAEGYQPTPPAPRRLTAERAAAIIAEVAAARSSGEVS
jgi:hypothetical protein